VTPRRNRPPLSRRRAWLLAALAVALAGAVVAIRVARPGVPPDVPAPVWGITIDSVVAIDEIEPALEGFRHKLTARIVFDPGTTAAEYRPAMVRIARHAWIMAEICDSYYMKKVDLASFQAATRDYYDGLKDIVNIWEIGNELNGEWLGDIPGVVAKTEYATEYVKARGGRTALTLCWNHDCPDTPRLEIWAWVAKNLTPRLRRNLDYVLLSYYEANCPPPPDWGPIFRRLGAEFPNAKVGFGEVGAEDPAKKPDLLRRYYGLKVDAPRYVGGYFWWYFNEDMLPKSRSMWKVLQEAVP